VDHEATVWATWKKQMKKKKKKTATKRRARIQQTTAPRSVVLLALWQWIGSSWLPWYCRPRTAAT
jgi:hypothetical protein